MNNDDVDEPIQARTTRKKFMQQALGVAALAASAAVGIATGTRRSLAVDNWFIGAPKTGRINCNWHSVCTDPPPDGKALDIDECQKPWPQTCTATYDVYARVNKNSYPNGTAGRVRVTSVALDCDSSYNPSVRRIVNLQFKTNTGVVLGTGVAQHVVHSPGAAVGTDYTTPKLVAYISSAGALSPGCWRGEHLHYATTGAKVGSYAENTVLSHTLHTPWKYVV